MKKLKKLWGKINLLETSAVGIPVYPSAHKSYFSLVKALSEMGEQALVGDELNLETKKMEGEESAESKEPEEKPEEESKEESKEPEEKAEESSESKSEETTETTETEEKEPEKKSISTEDLTAIIKAVKEGLKPERGLVEEKVDVQKELKKKSIGELAVMCGLFKEEPKMGSTLEVA